MCNPERLLSSHFKLNHQLPKYRICKFPALSVLGCRSTWLLGDGKLALTPSSAQYWEENHLIFASLLQRAFDCLPLVSLFSLHRYSKGDVLWWVTKHRDPMVAHQLPVFSVTYVPILQVFIMLLRKDPQLAGSEPTKMRNSFHDASINICFLPSRGHVPLHCHCKKELEFFR